MKHPCTASAGVALAVAAGLLLAFFLAAACAAPPSGAIARDVTFVVTLDGEPAAGAAVYAGGQPLPNALENGGFTTDSHGRLVTSLAGADTVVALAPAARFTTTRPAHDRLAEPLLPFAGQGSQPNWSAQVFWNSLEWDSNGAPVARLIDASGTYTLALGRQRPLILFNLLVSVEWDADQAYLDDLKLAMQRASTYLWDVTDGQMALGQVRIVDNREHWWDADIQVVASNSKIPHASIGGMEEVLEPQKYRVQLGPFWDRRRTNGPDSRWSEPDGFRTIVHELGHYALGLYDEYVGRDNQGHYCTARQPAQAPDGASIMNYQYTTSELSADDVPELWSPECEKTLQWQRTMRNGAGQSAWDTVAQRFSREGDWEVIAPHDHARSGPISTTWPAALATIPYVAVENPGSDAGRVAPFALTVSPTAGVSAAASVWLESDGLGCGAIRLGQITAAQPHLWVLGAHLGDRLHVRQEVDDSTWLCAAETITGTTMARSLNLQRQDFSCTTTFTECDYSPPVVQTLAGRPLLLAPFDPPRQQLLSDVTWQALPPLSLGMIPFNQDPAAVTELGFDGAFQDLFTASAVEAFLARAVQGQPPAGGALVCFAGEGACLPLDVGLTANTLLAPQGERPAGRPERLTVASNDGLLQVFQQGSEIPDDLLIVDSPFPAGPRASRGKLDVASRLYTLGGTWSNADLLVQIQADCCHGDDERPPRLYRIEAGAPVLVEDSWYAEQEGYVLATIREPGAYALLR